MAVTTRWHCSPLYWNKRPLEKSCLGKSSSCRVSFATFVWQYLKKMTFLSSQRYSSFWYVAVDACLLLLCYQEGAHFRKTKMTQSATLPLCFPHTDSHAHLHTNDEDCERVCCATAARSFIFLCSVIAADFITRETQTWPLVFAPVQIRSVTFRNMKCYHLKRILYSA